MSPVRVLIVADINNHMHGSYKTVQSLILLEAVSCSLPCMIVSRLIVLFYIARAVVHSLPGPFRRPCPVLLLSWD
jgi:hypothetical protein